MLVYDISDKRTFSEMEKFALDITKYGGKGMLVHVVGNKMDMSAKR